MTIFQGTTVTARAKFRNTETGAETDPGTVTARVKLPDKSIIAVTPTGVGSTRLIDIETPAPGKYVYEFEADGIVGVGDFIAQPRLS